MTNQEYLTLFLDAKSLEGRSEKTLSQYKFNIVKMLNYIDKPLSEITTQDLRNYLSVYKRERNVANVTLDNMRRNFNAFFVWVHNEGIIGKNPAASLNKIKSPKIIKTPFTEEELEIIRDNCKNLRESAMVEVLFSTGMRIGELEKLNIQEIDWVDKKTVVTGKGDKQREVYFNIKSIRTLKKYLDSRNDSNPALFVGLFAPYNRIKTATFEKILRELGERCKLKVHPHRFRRTCATTLLRKGMPVQEVSKILGHEKLETTLLYCTIEQESVHNNHKKYL